MQEGVGLVWGYIVPLSSGLPSSIKKKLKGRSCQESWYSWMITSHFSHLDSGLAFCQIVLYHVFMNRYRKYEGDSLYRVLKFQLVRILWRFEISQKYTFSFRQPIYVPTFKYFLVPTAQWNFLHRFLSSIPPDVLELFSKYQIFFGKLALFCVTDMEHFCDQYNFILPAFKYLRVATTQ